jgi:hypothetical protein
MRPIGPHALIDQGATARSADNLLHDVEPSWLAVVDCGGVFCRFGRRRGALSLPRMLAGIQSENATRTHHSDWCRRISFALAVSAALAASRSSERSRFLPRTTHELLMASERRVDRLDYVPSDHCSSVSAGPSYWNDVAGSILGAVCEQRLLNLCCKLS